MRRSKLTRLISEVVAETELDRYDIEEFSFDNMILYAVTDAYHSLIDDNADNRQFRDLFDYIESNFSDLNI